jgi:hypothetical protein
MTNGAIKKPDSPFWELIFPVCLLVVSLVAIWAFSSAFNFDCSAYGIVLLAYPLLFGAAGVLLGGSISVEGSFTLFGVPWSTKAVGGIGCAIIGFVIALVAKPTCQIQSWKGQVAINDIPILEPNSSNKPQYFVTATVESTSGTSTTPDFKIMPSASGRGTLVFRLDDKEAVILIRSYRQVEKAENIYAYQGSCVVKFQNGDIQAQSDMELHKAREGSQITLSFREGYGNALFEETRNSTPGKVENKCLEGEFAIGDGIFHQTPVQPPLYVSIAGKSGKSETVNLSFSTLKVAVSNDPAVAVKQLAQTDQVVNKEVLSSPGEIQVSQPPLSPEKVDSGKPPTESQTLPATCVSDGTLRSQVVSYLGGDDLDKSQRVTLYDKWRDISCLIVPISVNRERKFTSHDQARAIRLLTSAIINNGETSDKYYWQPNNVRRDFAKPLPFPAESDIKSLFELAASDDDPVRAEVLRFIKVLPVDQIETLFQQKRTQMDGNSVTPAQKERFTIAAAGLYYNRIVESLNLLNTKTDIDRPTVRRVVNDEFSRGQNWMRDAFFNGRSTKPYEAMLIYGKAITERWLETSDDRGKASFIQMLDKVRATDEPYPSRQQHIGQALAIAYVDSASSLQTILRLVEGSTETDLVRKLDGKSPFVSKPYSLYTGPKSDSPRTPGQIQVSSADSATILLQTGDWYLVRAKNKVGWVGTSL